MATKTLLILFSCVLFAVGCKRTASTEKPSPIGSPTTLAEPTRATDLSPYGIPGVIDLPPGFTVTQQEPSQVVIDRNDRAEDPFELRILPYAPINGTLQSHKRNMLDNDPYELVVDEAEGFAGWLPSKHPHPMADHNITVYREVKLGSRTFVAMVHISDFRANKELVHRVWKAAKSLRAK